MSVLYFQILQRDPYGVGRGVSSVDLDLIRGKDDPTTYFADGLRKIDFVLVFEEKGNVPLQQEQIKEPPPK